jgi:proteic killer suppression protein
MDILFASKNLERLCHDDAFATHTLGSACARKLRARLDDLRAVVNLAFAHKLPGRFHTLFGEFKGCFALSLAGNVRLVIRASSRPELPADMTSPLLKNVSTVHVVHIGEINA